MPRNPAVSTVRDPRKGAFEKAVPPPSKPGSTAKNRAGEPVKTGAAPPQDVQPITAGVVAQANHSRIMRQTEAAINLGIGLVLNAVGQREITIHADALTNFNAKFRVEQEVNPDGSYTIRVKERG